jgi:hypothetical protein
VLDQVDKRLAALARVFASHEIRVQGAVALFTARTSA